MERYSRQTNFYRKSKLLNLLFSNKLSDKSDPIFKFSDVEFKSRFKFEKCTVINVIYPLVRDELTSDYGLQLPPMLQLLVALRFFSCGAFQNALGDTVKISQPSVHRIVKKVSLLLAQKSKDFIKFPDQPEATDVRVNFAKKAGFPGVTGVIDCTHIPIKSPGGSSAEVFRNRKGFFSINVQAVCSPELKFTNIVARWPGSTHDSRIFKCSRLRVQLEQNVSPGFLIGDAGYGLERYLITAFPLPESASQKRFNKALRTTRTSIERTFGIWKKKFFCLSEELRTKLPTTLSIIMACAVLHNIAIDHNEYENADNETEQADEDEDYFDVVNENTRAGVDLRNHIVDQFFSS